MSKIAKGKSDERIALYNALARVLTNPVVSLAAFNWTQMQVSTLLASFLYSDQQAKLIQQKNAYETYRMSEAINALIVRADWANLAKGIGQMLKPVDLASLAKLAVG